MTGAFSVEELKPNESVTIAGKRVPQPKKSESHKERGPSGDEPLSSDSYYAVLRMHLYVAGLRTTVAVMAVINNPAKRNSWVRFMVVSL
jgi:hypothetical protein